MLVSLEVKSRAQALFAARPGLYSIFASLRITAIRYLSISES